MNFEHAMQVVQEYQRNWALPGLLETLQQMQDCYDDLSGQEARAYRVVFRDMSRLFAPA